MLNLRKHNLLRRSNLFGRLLRLPFLIIPKSMVIPILTGPLRGKKWIAGSHNNSVWLGTYESNQSLKFVQKSKESQIFLDLGAHAGYYTLLYKSVNKAATVYSFEPVETNYGFLQKHIKMNNLNNIFHFKKAVADKEGVLRFARGNSVGGKLSLEGDMNVCAIKLSRFIKEKIIQFPDLIKMDIEGAEYQVLKDLEPFLKSQKPVIFLSTHGDDIREACLNLMKSLDYKIIPLDEKSMIKAREYLMEPK
ncbi:FkbM family methyltransferase [Gillisia sp. Hel_I_86]|uniref:FkbM family methyltransferase n=1 Tax=Gillisia sp. Hel_I_86 TaxID=1249981 RepID=UPI0016460C68|nr:FkbM family methyltransferase [Gillisia sp. Hel_I_86]